ncbi:hypothetical protein MSG28_005595 [Choristoneura fumiferana]|uniref:Uncharacterized protein n=1 Tax=Choristoneura fumiferana TaxID=7141 RepID=A0ACC0KZJ6_CHOFU|nr:hypothetical protein MSG28_005595 [Choristoneura fumiferana]
MLRPLLDAFWSENVWLPPNETWADLTPGPDKEVAYTNHRHVLFPIPMALVFIALRFLMENGAVVAPAPIPGQAHDPRQVLRERVEVHVLRLQLRFRHPHTVGQAGVTNDIWWYYMVSSAFYWSLTLSQFWDVRRKDFWQMFVHHLATIALLSTTIRAPMLLPMFPAYYIFNSLLCLLLALHIVWTWLILQIAYKAIYAGKCVYEFVAGVRARAAGVAGPLEQREADAAVLDGGEVPCGQSALRVERRAEGHARVARGLPALVVAPDHVVLRQLEVAEEAEDVFDAGAERNVLERQHAARRAEVFQRTVGVLLARVTSVAPVLVAAAPAPSTPPAVEAAVEAPVEAAPAAPALAVEPAAAPVEAAAAAVVPAAAALVEAAPVEASVEASAVEASAVKAAAASEAAALGRARVEEGLLVDRGRAEQRVARVALGPVQRVLDHGARHQVHGDAAALQPVAVLGGRAARLAHGPELAEAVAGRHAGRVQHQMDARRHRARVREERDDGAVGGVARQALHQHTVELLLGVGGRRGRGEAGPGGPAGGGGARVQPAAGVASELLRREAAAERLLGRRERRREERHAGLLGGCGGRGRVEGAALARVARRGGFGLLGRRGLPQGLPRGLRLLPLKRLLLIVLLVRDGRDHGLPFPERVPLPSLEHQPRVVGFHELDVRGFGPREPAVVEHDREEGEVAEHLDDVVLFDKERQLGDAQDAADGGGGGGAAAARGAAPPPRARPGTA